MTSLRSGFICFLQNMVLMGFSVMVALVLGDLGLRLYSGNEYLEQQPVMRSGQIVYEPNQFARFKMFGEIDTEIRINSRGFRDSEFTPGPADVTAVALGDSFTEGWGVDLEQSYPKQLERLLKHGGDIVHVFNAGHYGTNPKNYTAVYDSYFKDDASVKLVTLGFFLGNDIVAADTPSLLHVGPPRWADKVKYFLSRNSTLYNFLRRQVRYSRELEQVFSYLGLTNPPIFPGDIYKRQNRDRWPYTAEFIRDFHESVKAQDRDFLLILIPTLEMVDDRYLADTLAVSETSMDDLDLFGFRDYIMDYCAVQHIPALDLTDAFIRLPDGERALTYYLQADGHWNAKGHELAAREIHKAIQGMIGP